MAEVKGVKNNGNDREGPVGVTGWPQELDTTNAGMRHSPGATRAGSNGVDLLAGPYE